MVSFAFRIVLVLFVTIPYILQAQTDGQVSPNTNSTNEKEGAIGNSDWATKSLLWKISNASLNHTSYLYGTIHMIGKEDFFMSDQTKKAFEECARVTFEINMEEMNDMSVVFSMLGKIMMNGDTTLKDILSKEDYDFVKGEFDKMGLPMLMFQRMKPLFLSTFATGEDPMAMQTGDVVSYEMEFAKMAKAQSKSMAGLETIDFQLSVFDSIPYKVQAEMLVESMRGMDGDEMASDQFEEMVKLYKAQDIEGMQKAFQDDAGGLGGYEEILLIGRNKNWIPIMEDMMTDKPTFFAVGAGHLGGPEGVIALLEKAGYQLTPLP